MIGTDVQNTTRPDLKGGAKPQINPETQRRAVLRQVMVGRMKATEKAQGG
jgi:hypothetical protein